MSLKQAGFDVSKVDGGEASEVEQRRPVEAIVVCLDTSASMSSTNVFDDDRSQETKLLCRSLACMRVQLHSDRAATTEKVKAEWDSRSVRSPSAISSECTIRGQKENESNDNKQHKTANLG